MIKRINYLTKACEVKKKTKKTRQTKKHGHKQDNIFGCTL